MPIRSFLFAPANHARRAEKSLTVGADAVILDLEDAVAISEKPGARPLAVAALQKPRSCLGYIRVNGAATPFCHEDIVAVVQPGIDGIVLPMAESAADVQIADWLIGQLERQRGLPVGGIDLMPIVETAKGVNNIDAILSAGTRLRRVAFGAADYALDLGVAWTRDEREGRYARERLAVASRAHGAEPPLDSVWARLDDEEGLAASNRTAQELGFQGKMCIHPNQIGPVNAAFTPSAEEVAFARRVVAAFAEAEAAGSAAFQIDGKFVDYPIVRRAEALVATMEAIEARARG